MLLSPKLDGSTVATLIGRVGNPALLTDAAKLDGELADEPIAEITSRVLLAEGVHPQAVTLSALTPACPAPAVIPSPHDPALITHTSGTTGVPKLAVHTNFTFEARYRPQAAVAALVRRREPIVIHVSFVHSRLVTALAIAILRGFPVVVLVDDAPERAAEIFLRVKPGILEAHPNTFINWEVLAEDPRRPLASVKYFSSTFDAIHPRTVRTLLAASQRRRPLFGQLYGQSEVGPIVARGFSRFRSADSDGRCVGHPFPGMTDVRIVSRNGQPPSADNPGYIEVRTDGRIRTYLGEQERYEKQLDNGWWRMGDVGYRTRWGCIHLLDREVDLIDGFGSTLAAEDRLFLAVDELTEVIIVAGPNGLAQPVVCTKNNVPLNRNAWDAAAAKLPPMAPPLHLRLDELPQTATTKIKRLELSARIGAGSL
ncbi:fatty-acid-CoA ligase FadD [Mycobacteroides abscessus subsp. abscessus]|nr:fatty-acid-CoA ligase FadD [Mycobacteroides abscessus subsp. abscessus]